MGDERRRFTGNARDLPPRGAIRSTVGAIREAAHRDEQLHRAAQVRSPAPAQSEESKLEREETIYTIALSKKYTLRTSIGFSARFGWTCAMRVFDDAGNPRKGGLMIPPRLLGETISALNVAIEEFENRGILNKNGR